MNFRAVAVERQRQCGGVEPENTERFTIRRYKGVDLRSFIEQIAATRRTGLLMVHIQQGGIGAVEFSEREKTLDKPFGLA